VKLPVKVIPGSSKDCIAGWLDDTLKIKVKAPPEKGKANKAVIKLLEKTLALTNGSVSIESGLTASRKTVVINCEDESAIRNKLANLITS